MTIGAALVCYDNAIALVVLPSAVEGAARLLSIHDVKPLMARRRDHCGALRASAGRAIAAGLGAPSAPPRDNPAVEAHSPRTRNANGAATDRRGAVRILHLPS